MTINILQYFDEAIDLEYKVSELYHLFSMTFIDDREFWWHLEIEEKNHAALLKTGKDFYVYGKFSVKIFPDKLELILEAKTAVISLIESFNSEWTRKKALDVAIDLENSAGEIHFQNFMHSDEQSDIADIFRKLNRHDIDHSQRIKEYKLNQGME
jgi:hypothetical protein